MDFNQTSHPNSAPRLRIIVLNWNLPQDTEACIDSLLQAGFSMAEISVIDNGSSDNSVARLRARYGEALNLRPLHENLGFAGGNNVGIRAALDAGADWICLLNNDTLVAKDYRAQMVAGIASFPTYRLLSPLIFYAPPAAAPADNIIWSLGDRRMLGTLVTRSLYRNRPAPSQLPPLVPVDFLTACSLWVHRDVFNEVGLLDERLFMYAEDVDFCPRASQAGYQLACVPAAHLWHKVSQSTRNLSAAQRRWRIVNQIQVYKRYSRGAHKLFLWKFTLMRSSLLAARAIIVNRNLDLARTTLSAWFQGWYRQREAL